MPDTLNTFGNLTTTASGPVTVVPTPTTPIKLKFIAIGGFGGSQLEAINSAVEKIPGVRVCRLRGQNDFQDPDRLVWTFIDAYPDVPIIFCGHSMGGMTAVQEANSAMLDARRVAGVVVLELVQYDLWRCVFCDCPNVLAFKADNSAPFGPTQIEGHPWQVVQVIPKFLLLPHNLICQEPSVIQQILDFVRATMGGG